TGTPILIQASADTVVGAFVRAAALALVSITLILLVVLRRVGDVLLTLVPLLLASVVTLELMVCLGLSLNFANIISLPMLVGGGWVLLVRFTTCSPGAAARRACSPRR